MSADTAKAKRTPAGQILRAASARLKAVVLTEVAVAMLWLQDTPKPILMKYMDCIYSSYSWSWDLLFWVL